MTPSLLVVALLSAAPPDSGARLTSIPGMTSYEGNEQILQSGLPPIPAELKEALSPYLEARPAEVLDVTADGKAVLIATRFGSTNQLHLVETPLGARTQLTFGAEPINRARFHPNDPNVIFFLRDLGGGEFFQVYRFDRRVNRTQLLTDGKSRHDALLISTDGAQLAFNSTSRNGKDVDVYTRASDGSGESKRVFEGEGQFSPLDFSKDGKQLLVGEYRSRDDGDLWLVDLGTLQKKKLTSGPKGSLGGARFAQQGDQVFAITDRFSEFDSLYRFSPSKPEAPWTPLSAELKWNVEELEVADDGSAYAFTVNEEGFGRLYRADGKAKPIKQPIPEGVTGRVRMPKNAAGRLFFSLQTARSVNDVYTLDRGQKAPVRWTRGELGGLSEALMIAPTLVRYPSTDGLTVPAFVYRPASEKGTGKVPVIIVWHGGPESQSRPWFSAAVQLFARRGFAVVVPNVRGSDGYGKTFRAADDGIKREASLADIGATLDFIATQADFDPTRVGVYGGSYGGYMVLATAAYYPKRIKAAVDVVGISSIPTFLANTQAYRRDLRRAEYGDERKPEVRVVQERISPLGSVEKIEAALYVQQGKNDPRVPQSEAEQIVRAVRGKGRDVWYFLALNEGHGFAKKENRDLATLTTVLFFEKQLMSSKP